MVLAAFCLVSPAAMAHDYEGLLSLPEGSTMMNVSATERTEVEQDTLTATLRFQTENADPAVVQEEINKVMTDALAEAKKVSTVEATTLYYNVYQYDRNQGKDKMASSIVWRGEQNLQIKSTDKEAVLDLAGKLQKKGLVMNGLEFSVSSALRDEVQSDLLEKALARLTAKAKRAGDALGKGNVELLRVDVGHGDSGYHPQPVAMRSMDMAGGAAEKSFVPVAEAGKSEITLDVSAIALLKK
jgi:predicted secreted protein